MPYHLMFLNLILLFTQLQPPKKGAKNKPPKLGKAEKEKLKKEESEQKAKEEGIYEINKYICGCVLGRIQVQ